MNPEENSNPDFHSEGIIPEEMPLESQFADVADSEPSEQDKSPLDVDTLQNLGEPNHSQPRDVKKHFVGRVNDWIERRIPRVLKPFVKMTLLFLIPSVLYALPDVLYWASVSCHMLVSLGLGAIVFVVFVVMLCKVGKARRECKSGALHVYASIKELILETFLLLVSIYAAMNFIPFVHDEYTIESLPTGMYFGLSGFVLFECCLWSHAIYTAVIRNRENGWKAVALSLLMKFSIPMFSVFLVCMIEEKIKQALFPRSAIIKNRNARGIMAPTNPLLDLAIAVLGGWVLKLMVTPMITGPYPDEQPIRKWVNQQGMSVVIGFIVAWFSTALIAWPLVLGCLSDYLAVAK